MITSELCTRLLERWDDTLPVCDQDESVQLGSGFYLAPNAEYEDEWMLYRADADHALGPDCDRLIGEVTDLDCSGSSMVVYLSGDSGANLTLNVEVA